MPEALRQRQPDESTTGRHLPALDGIRGIAIGLVLICHLFTANATPHSGHVIQLLAQLRDACWVGVDLFFVLSGFLITGILYDTRQGKHYFKNFYARRALRIFPLYYGVLLLVILIVWMSPCHLLSGIWYYITYTVSLKVGSNPYSTCSWLNLNHFWTLSVEELFYLGWPAVVFLAKTPRRILLAAVAGSLVSIVLRAFFFFHGEALRDLYIIYSFAPTRLDSLLAGGMLAIGLRTQMRDRILRAAPAILACGLAALTALLAINPALPWIGDATWTIGLYDLLAITFAALIATALHQSFIKQFLSVGVLRFLGRYSYGLYVFHYIIAGMLDMLLRRILHAWSGSLLVSVVGAGLIQFALTLAISVASYQLYEKRWLLLKRRFEDHTRAPKLKQIVSGPSPG